MCPVVLKYHPLISELFGHESKKVKCFYLYIINYMSKSMWPADQFSFFQVSSLGFYSASLYIPGNGQEPLLTRPKKGGEVGGYV